MKKLTKKLLLLAALTLLIAAITVTAAATPAENFTYMELSDGIYITGYSGDLPENLEFPSQINGQPVLGIAEFWVSSWNVKTVTIPDSYQNIISFSYWDNLETVNLGAGIEHVDCSDFADCFNLKAVNISPDNPNYTSIDGVVYNKDLSTLIFLPEGKTAMSTIPASVSDLSNLSWSRAAIITVEADSAYFVTEDGITYTADKTRLINCNANKTGTVTVPSSVTSMAEASFSFCQQLTAVSLPDSVTQIAYMQFRDCTSLKQINVPSSVQSIGYCAFNNCNNLNKVSITDVAAWCKTTFCSMSANPLYYAENLYLNNQLLENLQIDQNIETIRSYTFANADCVKTITLPDTLKRISWDAFYDCDGLTAISIPGSVESIDSSAFIDCSNLKTLQLGEGIQDIYYEAFAYCSALEAVTLPASLEHLSGSVFDGCTSLDKLTILSGNTSFGEFVFRDCPLSEVNLPADMPEIGTRFFSCSAMESYSVPNTVTEIGYQAFYNCDQLTQVNIPSSVEKIWVNAFAACDKLEGIWVDANNPNYSSDSIGALYDKEKTWLMQLPGAYEGAYRVPEGVTEINDHAFEDCGSLVTVTLPSTLNTLGGGAFLNSGIVQLVVPEGVEYIDPLTFSCNSLKTLYLPKSLSCINWWDCSVKDIYYAGTQDQWKLIEGTEYLENVTIHYNATGIPGGWKQVRGNWYFFGTDGSFATNWKLIANEWYYFEPNGIMVTGWKQIGGVWFYFTTDGDMVTGTVTIGGKQHRFDSNGAWQGEVKASGWALEGGKWYYYNTDGVKTTGWKQIDNIWYYFNSNGAMVTGWQNIGATWYYFQGSGAMATGWQKIGATWYYFQGSGAMATGWQKIGTTWYYFQGSGAMATGWLRQGGVWYYFHSSGAMASGWVRQGGIWYYFHSSGAMATGNVKLGNKTYRFNSSGVCLNP